MVETQSLKHIILLVGVLFISSHVVAFGSHRHLASRKDIICNPKCIDEADSSRRDFFQASFWGVGTVFGLGTRSGAKEVSGELNQ